MSLLTKDQILNAQDLDYKDVEVPEWGGTIRLWALSAGEAIAFAETLDGPAKNSSNVRILSLCVGDEQGNRLFTTADLEALKKKNVRVFTRVAREAIKLNGFEEEKVTTKAIKNE
jgi:hypothetical protein